ncbi:MAG: hypothetical protein PWP52_1198 [Bacteroidales bacterium]|nr:hypothetical protein [Bacteroidales bacterium]MDN5291348.1 hypothetical protein [Anaerophaga sp.]
MNPDKHQADFIEKFYIEMYYALLIYLSSPNPLDINVSYSDLIDNEDVLKEVYK